METVTVIIKNKSKKPAFLNFLRSIDYIEVIDKKSASEAGKYSADQSVVQKNLQKAFKNIKLADEGKLKLKTAEELIREMKNW